MLLNECFGQPGKIGASAVQLLDVVSTHELPVGGPSPREAKICGKASERPGDHKADP